MTALGSRDYLLCEISYLWDNGQLIGYTSKMYNYSEENGTTSSSFDVKIHYDEASEPYAVTLGEETYYYIRNAVGDVKGLINADTGEYVYALNTSAYGVLNFIEPDLTFDTSSLLPNQIEQIVKLMKKLVLRMCLCLPTANTYKGYSYDFFTGLYYLQSRYYDPEVGRFINADDVDYLGASGKPLSYNLFAYCENNPVNNSDPTGKFTLILGTGIVITLSVKQVIALVVTLFYLLDPATRQAVNGAIIWFLTSAKSLVNDAVKRIAKSVEKARAKAKTTKTHIHHIVAQKASRAKPARDIYQKTLKLNINSKLNCVRLNARFHNHLHTNLYFDLVNLLVVRGFNKYRKSGVVAAVCIMHVFLGSLNKVFF